MSALDEPGALDALATVALALGLPLDEVATSLGEAHPLPPWAIAAAQTSREARAEALAPRLLRLSEICAEAAAWP